MPHPNLFLIGAQKCGTTWLHRRLARHPEIFMSKKKELHQFKGECGDLDDTSIARYLEHFPETDGCRYYGESTPNYFWTSVHHGRPGQAQKRRTIPEQVKQVGGEGVSFVVLLRHPVGRAISSYLHHYRAGRYNATERIGDAGKRPLGILDMGFYDEHWRHWTEIHDKRRFFVRTFQNVVHTPHAVMDDLFSWLDVDANCGTYETALEGTRDNVGFQVEEVDYGLQVVPSGSSSAHIEKYHLDGAALPFVTHEEIEELNHMYVRVYEFVQEEFGIYEWDIPYTATDYVRSAR